MTASHLQLASRSPRRFELLRQLGVKFNPVEVEVDETPEPREAAERYVSRLARDKARAGYLRSPLLPTLGADTVVVLDGNILGKPRDAAQARDFLFRLAGRQHEVYTAVSICDGARQAERLHCSHVTFRALSDVDVDRYLALGEHRDKAGAYAIQGAAAAFIEDLRGSFSAVMGLPLCECAELLTEFKVPYWVEVESSERMR